MKNYSLFTLCILLAVAQLLTGCQPVEHRIVLRNQSAYEALVLVTGASPEEFPVKDSVVLPMEPGYRHLNTKNTDMLKDSIFAVMANDSFAIRIPAHSMVELTPMMRYYAAFTGRTIVLRHAGVETRVYTDYPLKTKKSFKKGFKKTPPALAFNTAGKFLYCDLKD